MNRPASYGISSNAKLILAHFVGICKPGKGKGLLDPINCSAAAPLMRRERLRKHHPDPRCLWVGAAVLDLDVDV